MPSPDTSPGKIKFQSPNKKWTPRYCLMCVEIMVDERHLAESGIARSKCAAVTLIGWSMCKVTVSALPHA